MSHKDTPIPIDEKIEERFSDMPHSAGVFCEEEGGDFADEYKLPRRYYINVFNLMPINSSRLYAYWEITDDLIGDAGYETFAFKLFDAGETPKKEIAGFYFRDRVGFEYIETHLASRKVSATISGVDISGRFTELMVSSIVCMPSDRLVHFDRGAEVWMDNDTGWMELIQRSMTHFSHAKSSHSYEEEMEILKNYAKENKEPQNGE